MDKLTGEKLTKEKSTTELTINYIKEHPAIKICLKKDLINYSSLARLISGELHIEKKTSKEAIVVAARRFQEKLKGELQQEKKIKDLLTDSEIETKNKMSVLVVEKNIPFELLEESHFKIKKEKGMIFLLEGSDHYTIIFPEKYFSYLKSLYKQTILVHHSSLALIVFRSPEVIEQIVGVVSFLTSLLAENGINIVELISCWKDTIFVIEERDLPKAFQVLSF